MRTLAIAFVLLIGSACSAQYQNCPACVRVQVAPQIIMRPQIQWQPYQYQGSAYYQKQYRTPLRNLLFGRGVLVHRYAPLQQQTRPIK